MAAYTKVYMVSNACAGAILSLLDAHGVLVASPLMTVPSTGSPYRMVGGPSGLIARRSIGAAMPSLEIPCMPLDNMVGVLCLSR